MSTHRNAGAATSAPTRTWRRDPEGRRERILEAAAEAFGRDGFVRTRMSSVAKSAGVAEGTVFHLFESKRALLIAVGERYGRALASAAFDGLPADFHPRDVGTIVRRIFAFVRRTEGPLAALLLSYDPAEPEPAREATRAQMLGAIAAALRGWARRGWIPPMNVRIAAELQFGLVENALRDCFLRNAGRHERVYIRETASILAAALGQRGGES